MGRAAAQLFAARGAKVIAIDISGAQAELAEKFGKSVVPVNCHVRVEAQIEAALAIAVSRFGRLDAVLNVAGFGIPGMLADVDIGRLRPHARYRSSRRNPRNQTRHSRHDPYWRSRDPQLGLCCSFRSSQNLGSVFGRKGWDRRDYQGRRSGICWFRNSRECDRARHNNHGIICANAGGIVGVNSSRKVWPNAGSRRAAALIVSDRAAFLSGAVIPIDGEQTAQLA